VSSSGHLLSPVVFDDLFRFRPYDPTLGYAQSRTANVLFAVEASPRWAVVVDCRPDTIAEMTRSVAAYAVDLDNAGRLWELSEAAL
jgi:hypothetical protein